jgi:DNA-binding transcriptional MerR regulator
MYTVKDVCRETGVSRKTLFYYDRIGLLSPSQRIGKQKIRLYSAEEIHRLKQIRFYQKAGLLLSEIRTLLSSPDADHTALFEAVIKRLEQKKQETETTILLCQKLKEGYRYDQTDLPELRQTDGSR